ncbi:MAG: helix-turn-helix transcriptional regulator [Chloroflexi bacterium]|nr:helix-turn-helix transcriptional regulator [Chloroflexota bacterium]
MADPDFRAAVEELEPAYQVASLRIQRGLTQAQLAALAGTTQSSIARLESGSRLPSLTFLRRVVRAPGGRLQLNILPEATAAARADSPMVQPLEAVGRRFRL